jgi:hypothetical protein
MYVEAPCSISDMSDKSEWKRLRQALTAAGCTVEQSRAGHYKVRRGKQLITVLPYSASDWRTLRNTKAHIRKLGISV